MKDLVLLTIYNETKNQLLSLSQIVKLIHKLEKPSVMEEMVETKPKIQGLAKIGSSLCECETQS